MSIDLTVVSLRSPDMDVCQRLAGLVLSRLDPTPDLSAVLVFELPSGSHEYGDDVVLALEAGGRAVDAYLAMYVLAVTAETLYGAKVVDEVDFFPRLEAHDVLRCCLEHAGHTPEDLWAALRRL